MLKREVEQKYILGGVRSEGLRTAFDSVVIWKIYIILNESAAAIAADILFCRGISCCSMEGATGEATVMRTAAYAVEKR